MAVLTAMVHDQSAGRVELGRDGAPKLVYRLNDADRDQLVLGLRGAARILFAAGAREVILPSVPPVRIVRPVDVDVIHRDVVAPHRIPITSVHPMGTMPFGDDPARSVVKSTGEHHQIAGLFVLDGSLFPTSIGVPPQISIYTFARHLVRHVVARARSAPG